MRMMVKKVGELVQEVDLENKYETLRDAVGGYIEAVYLEHGVVLWVNEEGKIIGLPNNFSIGNTSVEGDVIFTADNGAGENEALTDEQVKYIKSLLNKKPTAFQQYIDRLFNEKDLPFEIWTFSEGNFISNIDNKSVIATMRNEKNPDNQKIIRDTLVRIDFVNGDINRYLHHIASRISENQKVQVKGKYRGILE